MTGTKSKSDVWLTPSDSRPVLYELIDRRGGLFPFQFPTALDAAKAARQWWPDQSQDPDRTGKGWDIQECPKNP